MPTKSDIGEEDIIALLLLKKKRNINILNIARYFKTYLPKNYNPRYWAIVENFPRTPTYRINKKLINVSKINFYDYLTNKYKFIDHK